MRELTPKEQKLFAENKCPVSPAIKKKSNFNTILIASLSVVAIVALVFYLCFKVVMNEETRLQLETRWLTSISPRD